MRMKQTLCIYINMYILSQEKRARNENENEKKIFFTVKVKWEDDECY